MRRSAVWAVLAVAVFLGGCAGGMQAPNAGFLNHYSEMKQDAQDQSFWYWERPGVDWKKYDAFWIDRIRVLVDPEKSQRDLTDQELEKLAGEARDTLVKAVKKHFKVVDEPGPKVLRIQVALTQLVPVNPVVNAVTASVVLLPLDLGSAAIEVRFVDSTSGRVMAEAKDMKKGAPYELHLGWSRWSHVREAFSDWSEEFVQAWVETRNRK